MKILSRVPEDGVVAVAQACAEALEAGVANGDVVIAILARKRQPPAPSSMTTPDALKLKSEPIADCARYDTLRKKEEPPDGTKPDHRGYDEPQALWHARQL